jgi:hypothetical protein
MLSRISAWEMVIRMSVELHLEESIKAKNEFETMSASTVEK